MANFNQVTLVGNLTRNPDLRKTASGKTVVNGSIAVSRSWQDDKGAKCEEVCYVDWTAWAKLGEAISKFTGKGSMVLLSGHLKYETWDDNGTNRSKLFLVVEGCQFLDRKGDK